MTDPTPYYPRRGADFYCVRCGASAPWPHRCSDVPPELVVCPACHGDGEIPAILDEDDWGEPCPRCLGAKLVPAPPEEMPNG